MKITIIEAIKSGSPFQRTDYPKLWYWCGDDRIVYWGTKNQYETARGWADEAKLTADDLIYTEWVILEGAGDPP